MKRVSLYLVLLLFLGNFFSVKFSSVSKYKSLENTYIDSRTSCMYDSIEDSIFLIDDQHIYDKSESILLAFQTKGQSSVYSYTFQVNGFTILQHYQREKTYYAEISITTNTLNPFLRIKVLLSNGNYLESTAFGYTEKGRIAFSSDSYNDAELSLKYCLYKAGDISIEEYENSLSNQYKSIEENITYNVCPSKEELQKFTSKNLTAEPFCLEESNAYIQSLDSITTLSTMSNYTNGVNGVLQWEDDNGDLHPLEYVYIILYDKQLTGERILASTYTNASGYYAFVFKNQDNWFENGGLDIFIKVYASGESIQVVNGTEAVYYWKSSVVKNVATGSLTTFDAVFTMEENLGRAFQISQAVILASRYVKAMHGSYVSDVLVKYPHQESTDTAFYRRSNKTINIPGYVQDKQNLPQSYAAWDVIMHEYGHHVSFEFDIIDTPGGWHALNIDMADHFRSHLDGTNEIECECTAIPEAEDCKEVANRIVWCEAWATVFGTMAQQFYPHPEIETVGDAIYTTPYRASAVNLDSFNLEDTESTEQLIARALWNFFDSTSSIFDELNLGHQLFWNITTSSKAKTFPEFMDYYIANINNVEYISSAAKINAYFNIAPRSFKLKGETVTKEAPTFTWSKILSKSPYYRTMTYKVMFYDGNLQKIYESPSISDNTYTLSQESWDTILKSGNVIYATVYGGDISPGSGFYCSEWLCLKNPNEHITFNTYNRFTERTISLEAGEYSDFYITFDGSTTYDRVIQTFGNLDTTLTIYDEYDNQIAYNDDSGYEKNAQIQLKQQNGKKYKVRVKFKDSSVSGTTKLVIFIARKHSGLEPSSFDNFLEIYGPTTIQTYMQEGGSYVYKFIPSESRQYTIYTEIADEENIQDMYLYLIDPRSTLSTIYDDDGGLEESQARLRIDLEAGVPYLLIITCFNPDASGGPATIKIS